MKTILRTRVLLIVMLVLSCFGAAAGPVSRAQEPLRVTHVINGTLGDRSFFDSAQAGLEQAVETLGISLRTIELGDDQAGWETGVVDAMASVDDYDVMVFGGSLIAEYVMEYADDYPDKSFIFHDEPIDYTLCTCANVYNVIYAQNEGSYLAGVYAAAMMQEGSLPGLAGQDTIGALGGLDIPVINDFVVGYAQGARSITPEMQVLVQYVGGDAPFFDSARGYEIGASMFEQGADFVFNIAGGSGLGAIEAARDADRYFIGVDSDQWLLLRDTDPTAADRVLTSMIKNVGSVLYRALERHLAGELPYGQTEVVGIAEGAIGLARNEYFAEITPEAVEEVLEQAEADVINCRVIVETTLAPRPCVPPEGAEMPGTETAPAPTPAG